MHTHRSTLRRALGLAGLLLLSACAGEDQGLGRQPASTSSVTATSAPSASPSTSPTTSGGEQSSAAAATTPSTEPMATTVPAEPEPTVPPATVAPRRPPVTLPAEVTSVVVDGLPRTLRRIGGCESIGDPDGPLLWRQPNLQGSSASGAFQVLDSTWATWARSYGAGTDATSYSRAMHAPPSTQVAVVVRAYSAEGTTPWVSSRSCWAG